ncbi:DUF3613 domain-containing protein [Variovorax paradoxus]|uniref:DUF3613 domain-containing protein n=1 Tax=Variovorax paradoxus TaxID=34073 RepID=A0AAW8EKQ8_VARPD|nr:DUF3613 domain-containing protein [Variovorax paradoxus]MDP9973550.1 hypothetical protein [Variovorax paradoxus]
MNKEFDAVLRAPSACGWVLAILLLPSVVMAQTAAPSGAIIASTTESTQTTPQASSNPPPNGAANTEEAEERVYAPLQVGDATQSLLAWQRSGDIASKTSRPIAGPIAQRSYERYLKSFEFPVPERLSSTVKTTTGSGAK